MAEKGGVYVLDEPTTGLHLADVEQLLGLLDRLVDSGKSVIVIEHHQAVMAHADWIIDLGPGAGHDGGRIVFEGTPADLVAARSTLTGEHLAAYVGARQRRRGAEEVGPRRGGTGQHCSADRALARHARAGRSAAPRARGRARVASRRARRRLALPSRHGSRVDRPVPAGMVARGRFVEDLVAERAANGVAQYVLLGAGLDTFAQRRSDVASRMRVYEIDQAEPQAWKRSAARRARLPGARLAAVRGRRLRVGRVVVGRAERAGFDTRQPAVVVSTGVSMYLTEEATVATLRRVAELPAGSLLAMTFLLPTELLDEPDRAGYEAAQEGARRSGTPFISLYTPDEMLTLAREAGFARAEHVSAGDLAVRYFADRADGLRPSSGEDFLVATT